MKKYARGHACLAMAASVFAGSFTSLASAQMPGNQFSPWNQVGRAWGIGIGDGYHECANCPRALSKGYGINAFKTSGDRINANDASYSGSWFSKVNPFGGASSSACGVPGCTTCSHGSSQGMPSQHIVLPPSSASYHQFTTPAETPLPWSSEPQTHYQPSTIPSNNMSNGIPGSGNSSYSTPRVIEDPIEYQQSPARRDYSENVIPNNNSSPMTRRSEPTPATRQPIQSQYDTPESIEPKRMLDRSQIENRRDDDNIDPEQNSQSRSPNDELLGEDLMGKDYLLDSADVPPPPMRRRQPSDRPLGETPNQSSPRPRALERTPNSDDLESLLPNDDESFELVPNRELPPVTHRRVLPTRQATKAIPASLSYSWNDRMHQETRSETQIYVDDGYSRRQPVGGPSLRSTANPADRNSYNRYR